MSIEQPQNFWKNCSPCKKPIPYGAKYYQCSVSTCNGQRTGYVFCSVACFERHLPGARHRDAAAIESFAPKSASAASVSSTSPQSSANVSSSVATSSSVSAAPVRRTIVSSSGSATASSHKQLPREVLIIASRLKEYVIAKSEYNTSASVMDVLSDYVRVLCDRAIDNARNEGRKTVLERDFDFLRNLR